MINPNAYPPDTNEVSILLGRKGIPTLFNNADDKVDTRDQDEIFNQAIEHAFDTVFSNLAHPSLGYYQLTVEEVERIKALDNAGIVASQYLNSFQQFDKCVSQFYPEILLEKRRAYLVSIMECDPDGFYLQYVFQNMQYFKKEGLLLDDMNIVAVDNEAKAIFSNCQNSLRANGFSLKMILDILNTHEGFFKLNTIHCKLDLFRDHCGLTPADITSVSTEKSHDFSEFINNFNMFITYPFMKNMGFTDEQAWEILLTADNNGVLSLEKCWDDCVALGLTCDNIEKIVQNTPYFDFQIIRVARVIWEPLLKNRLFTPADLFNLCAQPDGHNVLDNFLKQWAPFLIKCHQVPKGSYWPQGTFMELMSSPAGREILLTKAPLSHTDKMLLLSAESNKININPGIEKVSSSQYRVNGYG